MVKFSKLKYEEAIEELLSNKQVIIVTGAFFGDEAKGKTIHSFSKNKDVTLIARVNSGENAGHTVVHEGNKFVFHLLPSGVVSKKKTIVSDNCVMDPISFYENEVKPLIDSDISTENIFLGNVSLVCPWHKIADALRDPNASTMKGMSQIHSDIVTKCDPRFEDLINKNFKSFEKSCKIWMSRIKPFLNEKVIDDLLSNPKLPTHVKNFIKNDFSVDKYLDELNERNDIIDFLKEHYNDCDEIMFNELKNEKKILLEGPQSYFLSNQVDIHHSTSTSASTHSTGIYGASNLPPKYTNFTLTINVAKFPGSSRVGLGANPSGYVSQDWFSSRSLTKDNLVEIDFDLAYEQFLETIDDDGMQDSSVLFEDSNGENIELNAEKLTVNSALAIAEIQKYGEFGSTTGKPRVTGPLDLPHLAELKRHQQGKISISCMDRGDGLKKVLLVTSYVYEGEGYNYKGRIFKKGDIIDCNSRLPGEEVLKDCKPVYEILDGWKNVTELDENVQRFLNRVEELTRVKVISIGYGPDTEAIMYLKRE